MAGLGAWHLGPPGWLIPLRLAAGGTGLGISWIRALFHLAAESHGIAGWASRGAGRLFRGRSGAAQPLQLAGGGSLCIVPRGDLPDGSALPGARRRSGSGLGSVDSSLCALAAAQSLRRAGGRGDGWSAPGAGRRCRPALGAVAQALAGVGDRRGGVWRALSRGRALGRPWPSSARTFRAPPGVAPRRGFRPCTSTSTATTARPPRSHS